MYLTCRTLWKVPLLIKKQTVHNAYQLLIRKIFRAHGWVFVSKIGSPKHKEMSGRI